MINILQPWINKKGHIDSTERYFASVQACDALKKRGLRFIGVVKTSTKSFCIEKLLEIDLVQMVLRKG